MNTNMTRTNRWLTALLAVIVVSFTTIQSSPVLAEPRGGPHLQTSSPQVKLVSASSQQVILDVQVDRFDAVEVTVADATYQRVSLAGTGGTSEVGKPELPVIGQFVAIPSGASVSMDVVTVDQSILPGYLVYPAQKPPTNQGGTGDSPFIIDQDFYQQDTVYPQEYVTTTAPQTLRDLNVVRLSIHPLQFNPARHELRFAKYMRIRLKFTGQPALLSYTTPTTDNAFQDICQRLVLNCNVTETSPVLTDSYPRDAVGAEYLIITAPSYLSAANTLAEWKNKRGIKTVVKTTSETGTTTTAIKDYIQTVYDTWSPRPAYVLLLGDVEVIPVFYVTVHPLAGQTYPSGFKTGTDLYYATMGGSGDLLPDIHLGRISVDSLAEANHVVNKIIAYETNPPSNAGFYNRVTLATYFEDSNYDGVESQLFTQTSEQIRDYLLTQGYDVQRIYSAEADVSPRWYYDGTPIPSELLRPGFAWNGQAADIVNTTNNGTFILSHRDHGFYNGWMRPAFYTWDMDHLNNGAETPVVFSINCESGWFDTETDGYDYGSDPSFAEKFLRYGSSGQGGAVSVFAATRTSWSWHNDVLIKGFYDSIWPGFLSYSGSNPSYRMGNTLSYGKYYYASVYGTSSPEAVATLEMYHYHGDPTMEIWTAAPSNLTVSHAETATAGETYFTVNVSQNGALVSIVQNGAILGTATSSGGSATVSLGPGFVVGTANVTVTKHNYRPYQGTVTVNLAPPVAPSGLTATPVSQTQIDLAWIDNSINESGFKIEWSPNGTSGWTQIATVGANVATYSNTGLTCDTTYYYRVRAYNAGGDSGFSNDASATTVVCTPAAPSNLTATAVSQTQINLTWTDNSNNESGFKIERSPNGTSSWTQIASVGANESAYSNTSLSCGTTYYYRVRAYNAGGDSGYSNMANTTTVICTPAAPSNLTTIAVSQTRIDLAWTDNSNNESGFKIERSLDDIIWTQVATVSTNITSYSNSGLDCGTDYYYRVRGYNAGGDSDYSNIAGSVTVVCVPAAPSNLTATPVSQTQISLAWVDNSTNESGFKIERSPNGPSDWAQIGTVGANVTTYNNTSLDCDTTYHYRVRAYNIGGDSGYSNAANATTVVCSVAAPTNLTATPISQTQINLAWTDNSNNESGFKVERSPNGASDWTQIATVGADVNAYSDTGLTCHTTYYYRVRAYEAGDNSNYSNTANTTTIVCPLSAPSNLTATPVSQTQIDLAWTDNSNNEDGFKIERSPNGTSDWTQIATVGANVTTYSNSGLTCSTAYYYRVRAYNASSDSGYSNTANATTITCTPAAPSGLTATQVSQTQINLAWTDNSNNESGFKIERSPNGTSGWTQIAMVGANVTAYSDTGLTCSTTYYYRVRAYNAGGNSGYSNTANTTTVVCTPTMPSGLTATQVSQAQIDLAWVDNSNNESGFKIERSPNGTSDWTQIATIGANITTYSNTGLTCGTTYYYRVRAYNAGGDSGYSNTANGATVACAPVAPSGLTATQVSQTQINLAWTDNSSNENGFKIERSPNGASGWTQIATVGAGVTTYGSTGLTCSTTYYYRVRAYNAGGDSGYSNTANTTTVVCTPTMPSGLTATQVSQAQIDLAWVDNSNNESGFKIERSPNGTSDWTQIATVGANVIAYSSSGLNCGTIYYYRVHAYNAGGESDYSNTASATTVVCTPYEPDTLIASPISRTQIDLAWTDNSRVESGFKIERSPNGTSGWTQIATVGANVTTYSDTGLTCSTTYYYRVRAYNAGGNSDYSNTAHATTVVCAADVPSHLIATPASQTRIDLAWTDNSNNEDGFRIERSPDGVTWTSVYTTAASVVAYTDADLPCGETFYYRIQAYNAGGTSDYSNTAYATTIVCTPDRPKDLTATAVSQTQIDLTWMDNGDDEEGFKIERSPDGLAWTRIAIIGANVTDYSDSGLICNTTYYYRVHAYSAGGESDYSHIASATTVVCTPAMPDNLTATPASQTQIDLAWTGNSDNESGFQIERSPDGATGWTQIAVVDANVTHFSNLGLVCGTTYYYRVRAHNAGGESDYSNMTSSTTIVCSPAAPGNLTATPVSQTQVDLAWMDNSDNESGFRIERSPDGTTGWTQIAAVDADVTRYSDLDMICNTTYYYRVHAYNAGGESGYSDTASAVTVICTPATPNNLTATPVSQTQIDLAWTDDSDNASGFQIERSSDGAADWVEIADVSTNNVSYSDADLTCGETFYYRIRAYNAGGNSGYSNTAQATTLVCQPAPLQFKIYIPIVAKSQE
jgi:hypothetical protein